MKRKNMRFLSSVALLLWFASILVLMQGPVTLTASALACRAAGPNGDPGVVSVSDASKCQELNGVITHGVECLVFSPSGEEVFFVFDTSQQCADSLGRTTIANTTDSPSAVSCNIAGVLSTYPSAVGCRQAQGIVASASTQQALECNKQAAEAAKNSGYPDVAGLTLEACLARSIGENNSINQSAANNLSETGGNDVPTTERELSLKANPLKGDCKEAVLNTKNCTMIKYLVNGINFLSALAGLAIVGSIMMAGYQYMTARDNSGQVQAARIRITWALIALLIFVLMYSVLNFLVPGGVLP